jgi:hypothetical protein
MISEGQIVLFKFYQTNQREGKLRNLSYPFMVTFANFSFLIAG